MWVTSGLTSQKVGYPPNISDYESKKGNIRKIGFHKTP